MAQKPSPEQLAKFLAGTADESDEAEIDAWLASDPIARPLLENLRIESRPDVEAVLQNILGTPETARPGDRPGDRPATRREQRSGVRIHGWNSNIRIAAVLAAISILGIWFWSSGRGAEAPPALAAYETGPGERLKIRLSDGTEVELNVDSRITIAASFGLNDRRVELDGEAYFDVAGDSRRPFVVNASDAVVKVVGTSFNVSAYDDQASVSVSVAEGRVQFGNAGPDPVRTVVLDPGQTGMVSQTDGSVTVDSVDPGSIAPWRRGELRFAATPLPDVGIALERWYNVTIEVNGSIRALRLDASFTNKPLTDVLDRISRVLPVQYTLDGNRVVFYPAGEAN